MPRLFTSGVVVHDHFKPYFTMKTVGHALCNAHHLRELKAVTDYDHEPWANKMARVLLAAAKAVRHAVANGADCLADGLHRRISALYDQIIRRGTEIHERLPPIPRKPGARGKTAKRTGHNLLVRLRDFKAETLRFMVNFSVPFTNNQAEQDVRMMKVKMKISGGFRIKTGADIFATLRSVLSTARKQGWDMINTINANPSALIQALNP